MNEEKKLVIAPLSHVIQPMMSAASYREETRKNMKTVSNIEV